MIKIEELKRTYAELFSEDPIVVASPGRINIIGEHTDYNDGFVLPAAIDKAVYVAIQKREDDVISLYSAEFKEYFEISVSKLAKSPCHWANYILGVADQCMKKGLLTHGFNMVIDGDLPIGAGLSSSAAVECAAIYSLNELYNWRLSTLEMVQLAQKAEHEFSGVMCGIMDMFASMHGRKEHAIKLDCRSLDFEYIPLQLGNHTLVLFNTNVKHNLASSAYNERRQQCIQGLNWVKETYPDVNALRDVSISMLDNNVRPKDELIYKRCSYVVNENLRIQNACVDLKIGNLASLGTAMFATHEGLSQLYEVSCKELDILVDIVKQDEAVIGARMMGGGFGGCTLNLVKSTDVDRLIDIVKDKYHSGTGLNCDAYVVSVAEGTAVVA